MPKFNRAADETTLVEWMTPEYRILILSDPDFLRQLLDLAIHNNQLEEILLCKEDPDSSNASVAYINAITMHHVESLMLLLDYSEEHFKQYPAIASNVLNLLVEDYLEHREDFYDCTQRAFRHPNLQAACAAASTAPAIKTQCPPKHLSLPEIKSDSTPMIEKIRSLLNAFKTLLADEARCQPYFEGIESDLKHAVAAENQQDIYQQLLSKRNYTRTHLEDVFYPIPHANYKKTKKNSLLMGVLQARLESHSFPKSTQRWAGMVPGNIANAIIGDHSVLFTESQYGAGLFHGKFMHAIQLCVLAEFMKNHPELTTYGEGLTLTLTQVITYMVNMKLTGNYTRESNWWNFVIDVRHKHHTIFSDPFQLHSYLLFAEQFPYLSAYLRDSFCGGFLDLLNAVNGGGEINFTIETFTELLSKATIDAFFFPEYLYEAAQRDYLTSGKGKHTMRLFGQPTKEYLVTEKQYPKPRPG